MMSDHDDVKSGDSRINNLDDFLDVVVPTSEDNFASAQKVKRVKTVSKGKSAPLSDDDTTVALQTKLASLEKELSILKRKGDTRKKPKPNKKLKLSEYAIIRAPDGPAAPSTKGTGKEKSTILKLGKVGPTRVSDSDDHEFEDDLDLTIVRSKVDRATELAKEKTCKTTGKSYEAEASTSRLADDVLSLHPESEFSTHEGHESDESVYEHVDTYDDDEKPGKPLPKSLADKINDCWKGSRPHSIMKPLYDKYSIPENCQNITAPRLNPEIWALLKSKWQRKAELQYAGIQKTIQKVAAATIELSKSAMENATSKEGKVKPLQITMDSLTMLNQASYEISLKRKQYIKSVIKPEYHGLCVSSSNITSQLFGDDLAKDIKESDIKKRLSNVKPRSNTYGYNTRSNYHYNKNSFLGQGQRRWHRGRYPNYKNQNGSYHNKNRKY